MPVIPPNNTTGLYGLDTTVRVSDSLQANNITASGNLAVGGNAVIGGNLSVLGNILANVSVLVPGANTQVIINDNGGLGASANLTFTGTELDVVGAVSATGNITGNYILGNGAFLTGVAASYGNANVAAYLPTYSGALNPSTVSATGNITGNYILGNGSQLTGIVSSYGNANVAAYLPTYTGALAGSTASVSGNITGGNIRTVGQVSATGNITGNYILGDGSLLTGLPATYGNANVAAYLPTYTGNLAGGNLSVTSAVAAATVSASGNITGGNIVTAGAVSATGNLRGANISLASRIIGDNNAVISFLGGTDIININGGGPGGAINQSTVNLGTLSAIGNITSDNNINSAGAVSATGNITGGNIRTAGQVSATGNITGARFFGDGGFLSNVSATVGTNLSVSGNIQAGGTISSVGNITGGNVSGYIVNGVTGNFDVLQVAGNISAVGSTIFAGAANITGSLRALGSITAVGNINMPFGGSGISVNGNITGSYINGNGAGLTGLVIGTQSSLSVTGNITAGNVNVPVGSVTALQGNINNLISGGLTTGAISASSTISAAGTITASGGLTGSPINSTGTMSAFGNITGANLITAGLVTAGGNITGGNLIVAPLGNVVVGNTVSPGRVQFGTVEIYNNSNRFYVNSAADINGQLSAVGGIYGANVFSTGLVSATGNITGNYFIGNGSALTGITTTLPSTISVTGNITGGNLNTAGTVSTAGAVVAATISATGNITGGNLITGGNIVDTGALTILTGSNGNIALAPDGTGTVTVSTALSAVGNITGGNITTAGRSSSLNYTETQYNAGNITGTWTPNIANGSIQYATLTGNITANSITNINNGQSMFLILTQDATGGRLLTSSWKFAGNTRTLSTAANATDVISVVYANGTYYASLTTGYA